MLHIVAALVLLLGFAALLAWQWPQMDTAVTADSATARQEAAVVVPKATAGGEEARATEEEAAVAVPQAIAGGEEARAWLKHYYSHGLRGPQDDWPAAVGRPNCEAPRSRLGMWLRRRRQRRNLLLATVSDGWGPGEAHNRWLDDPAAANFDLVVVYFGANDIFTCSECLHVFRGQGPK